MEGPRLVTLPPDWETELTCSLRYSASPEGLTSHHKWTPGKILPTRMSPSRPGDTEPNAALAQPCPAPSFLHTNTTVLSGFPWLPPDTPLASTLMFPGCSVGLGMLGEGDKAPHGGDPQGLEMGLSQADPRGPRRGCSPVPQAGAAGAEQSRPRSC